MTRLFYCHTHYDLKPPVDINPLILQRYPTETILVLCAREGMVKRIDKMKAAPDYPYPKQTILALGWWDLKGEISATLVLECDVVVVVGKDRIDKKFLPLLYEVEQLLCKS